MVERKELTSNQQAIPYIKRKTPNWDKPEIANAVGCSDSHVSEPLNR